MRKSKFAEKSNKEVMSVPQIFETCRPRLDVLSGSVADADFAADLASVVAGRASNEYLDCAASTMAATS